LKNGVACGVAEGIVDQIETIDPEERHRQSSLVVHELTKVFADLGPIRQPGKQITVGRFVQLALVGPLIRHIPTRHQYAAEIGIIDEVVGDRLECPPLACRIRAETVGRGASRRASGGDRAQLPAYPRAIFRMDEFEHPPPDQFVRLLTDRVRRGGVQVEQSAVRGDHDHRSQQPIRDRDHPGRRDRVGRGVWLIRRHEDGEGVSRSPPAGSMGTRHQRLGNHHPLPPQPPCS
jgi:hypothetical protein